MVRIIGNRSLGTEKETEKGGRNHFFSQLVAPHAKFPGKVSGGLA